MKNDLKWGVFSLSQYPDQSMRVEGLENDMKLFELAEALGYDTVWLAEHLFSTYGHRHLQPSHRLGRGPTGQANQDRHRRGGDPVQSPAAHGGRFRAAGLSQPGPVEDGHRPGLSAA